MPSRARAAVLAAALIASVLLPGTASGSQSVKLAVSFAQDRLGVNTTIALDATISGALGQTPSPALAATFTLPPGMGLDTSTLGLATCNPQALLARGTEGCSPNAIMGYGSVRVEVPFGSQVVQETAQMAILMGVAVEHHTKLLFYADGESPVSSQILIPGVLSGSAGPSTQFPVTVPLIASVPGAPDASVVEMRMSIGPEHVTYYKRAHGRTIPYRPSGIAVPETCPRGGFPFIASFRFQDGTSASATKRVPCPRRARPHR